MDSAVTSRNPRTHSPKNVRIHSARPLAKSKTTANLVRPLSGKPKDFYSLSRILPKNIAQDKEKLFEDNLRLKLQSNDIQTENAQLKTKIKQLEFKKKKHDDHDAGLTLVSTLKASIKQLQRNLNEKDKEISLLRRNLRTCKLEELEVEMKAYKEECTRLSNHLSEFMKQNSIPASAVEYENRIFNKANVINQLKKELQDTQFELGQTKENLIYCRDKITSLEKKQKKSSPLSLELKILKDEYELLTTTNQKAVNTFKEREAALLREIENLTESIKDQRVIQKALEKDNEEKASTIEGLRKQLSLLKDENNTNQTNLDLVTIRNSKAKLKNPPRLFTKIMQITKERNLMLSVFLTLLDKNNNGLIDPEELRKGIILHGKPTKRKHITSLLSIFKVTNKTFYLNNLEEWIERYDYKSDYSSSSEEEIIEPVKSRPVTLSFKPVNPDPKYNEIIIPEVTVVANLPKEKNIPLIKVSEIANVLERITLYMQEKYLAKNRFLTVLFGNSFNPDIAVDAQQIADVLVNSVVYLGEPSEVKDFALFLVEPEGVESLRESDWKRLKKNVLEFSKKLQKVIPDWEIIDRHKAQLEFYKVFEVNKEEIDQDLQKVDLNGDGRVGLQDFRKVLQKFKPVSEDSLRHLYLLSYSATKVLGRILYNELLKGLEKFQQIVITLRERHQKELEEINNALFKAEKNFEDAFGQGFEFLVPMDNVVESLASLGVKIHDGLLGDLNIGRYTCDLSLMRSMLIASKDFESYSFN